MKSKKDITEKKEENKSKKVKNTKKVKHKNIMKKRKNFNIFRVNGEFKLFPLIINILLPIVSGIVVGYINKNSIATYEMLKKPTFTPPEIIFPIVFSILYILMGIGSYRIYMRNKQGMNDKGAYFFYLVQLIVNLMWSFIFFTFRLYGISFLWIVMLFILVTITFIKFMRVDKLAGILLILYMFSLIFIGALNYFIWVLNEM